MLRTIPHQNGTQSTLLPEGATRVVRSGGDDASDVRPHVASGIGTISAW